MQTLAANAPLRVAIVGCGKIADHHVAAIRRIPESQIVAVCDRESLMAKQVAERFRIQQYFSDFRELLQSAKPDVVHITTPPESHFTLGKQSLEAGCHVYLEKPFTVTAEEALSLVELAQRQNLKITAGHNFQFTLEMLEMRQLVQQGFLGGRPVHLESYFPYSLEDSVYAGVVLQSRTHWVRQLPGQLLHNVISHPVAQLAEFLDDEIAEIHATAHQSARLRALGGEEVLDELRVLIRDRNGATAFLCFSTQLRPGVNQLRICGPRNSIILDHSSGSVIRQRSSSYKSYLTYFIPPLNLAREYLRSARRNLADFLSGRLHQDAGVKELIQQFYSSIRTGGNPPIPYRDILLTAKIMDEIFAQIYPARIQSSIPSYSAMEDRPPQSALAHPSLNLGG